MTRLEIVSAAALSVFHNRLRPARIAFYDNPREATEEEARELREATDEWMKLILEERELLGLDKV